MLEFITSQVSNWGYISRNCFLDLIQMYLNRYFSIQESHFLYKKKFCVRNIASILIELVKCCSWTKSIIWKLTDVIDCLKLQLSDGQRFSARTSRTFEVFLNLMVVLQSLVEISLPSTTIRLRQILARGYVLGSVSLELHTTDQKQGASVGNNCTI